MLTASNNLRISIVLGKLGYVFFKYVEFVQGRGALRFRTPEGSSDYDGSRTPPHWRREQVEFLILCSFHLFIYFSGVFVKDGMKIFCFHKCKMFGKKKQILLSAEAMVVGTVVAKLLVVSEVHIQ